MSKLDPHIFSSETDPGVCRIKSSNYNLYLYAHTSMYVINEWNMKELMLHDVVTYICHN